MANIKSWADHCSSDEESDDERIAPPPSNLPGSTSYNNLSNNNVGGQQAGGDDEESEEEAYEPPPRKQFEIPPGPPYTAFLGNLSYDMRDSNDLGYEVEDMLKQRKLEVVDEEGKVLGGGEVRLSGARLMTDRESGRSKGFGYLEFETSGELLAFLHMDNPQLCGRSIKVDVASGQRQRGGDGGRRQSQHQNRGSRGGGDMRGGDMRGGDMRDNRGGGSDRDMRGSNMGRGRGDSGRQFSDHDNRGSMGGGGGAPPQRADGAQFMGGRYNRGSGNNLGGSGGGMTPTAVMKRSDSSGNAQVRGDAGGAPRQRPSLKLAARTKPVGKAPGSTVQSSIFGGAKPRDETKFAASEKKESKDEGAVKDVASGVEKIDIKKKDDVKPAGGENAVENGTKPDTAEPKKEDSAQPTSDAKKESTKQDNDAPSSSNTTDTTATAANKKSNNDRKDSRGGRGGRGGGGRRDSKRGEGNRRDSTRKSGRGGRGGGGKRQDSGRGAGGGEGRNNDNRRNSKASKNGNNDNNTNGKSNAGGGAGTSSLAAAAAAGDKAPAQNQQQPPKDKKKSAPKKANSFAAFMDESDDE